MAGIECLSVVTSDIQPDCANPIVKGIERNAVLINRDDIESYTYSKTQDNVIEGVKLKTGKKGYSIGVYGKNPYEGSKSSMVVGNKFNSFTKVFSFVILETNPETTKQVIEGLANGQFVVVFENKYKNMNKMTNPGDSAFELYGVEQGLTATAIENDKYSDDTNGGWSCELTEEGTPRPTLWLYKTTYEATKQLFNSLLTASA